MPASAEANPAGDIPDTQVYIPYTAPGTHFSLTVPQGWARTVAGTAVTFTDKLNTITVQEVAAPSAPTPASVTTEVLPLLRAQTPAFAPGTVSVSDRKGGSAVLMTFQGDSAPNPVTGRVVRDAFERYAFWHNNITAIVTLSGPVGADNVDPWRIVSDSVRWL